MGSKNYTKVIMLSIAFFSLHSYTFGQKIIFGDDYKNELWKNVKPTGKNSLSLPKTLKKDNTKSNLLDNKYTNAYSNYKYGNNLEHLLEITEFKYKLSPNLTIYNGITPINELPAGSTQIVFMGGHFYFVGTGGVSVFPSGIDLTGGGRKKLSEKSKNILRNVFGMEVDE